MYNNDVTYADKWETPENLAALAKLESKYFDMSECSPDCPISWAVEVLELMETIDRELGFRYNEDTMRGYYISGNLATWFIKNPWSSMFEAFKRNIFNRPNIYNRRSLTIKAKSITRRLFDVAVSFFHPIGYGLRALKIMYVNPHLNKILNKRVRLGQLKEKYGELRIYFTAPDAFEEFIEREIRKTEVKLAMKGAYSPIEMFWNAGISYNIGTSSRPDTIEITHGEYKGEKYTTAKFTKYRNVMKELGLNLKEIEDKYDLYQASKADPIEPLQDVQKQKS